MSCTECTPQRTQQGPHYDPARRTGRTSQRVKTAIIAAMSGHRVLYVTHSDQYARELCLEALRFMLEAECTPAHNNVTAYRITLLNGGWLEFRSMGAMPFNRGLKAAHLPSLELWDHFAEEERERKKQEQIRLDDAATIKQLMRKHGWHKVDDIMCRPAVTSPTFNTLAFRT